MRQTAEIINALGGTSAVARALSLTPSTVSSWKSSGCIPAWRRQALIDFAATVNFPLHERDFESPSTAMAPHSQLPARKHSFDLLSDRDWPERSLTSGRN